MRTYGHSLLVALRLAPTAEELPAAVAAAGLAEDAGYDLVVLRDRGEGGPDAVSLAAWVAARSSRVSVAPQIATAGRTASVLGRALGSLQLLSNHRGLLVLDGGDSAEDVADLADAVQVVRTLHDTSRRGRVSHNGTHHRLSGAEPGPAVDRPVPVWVSGSAPAVAALAGREADGWLVALADLGTGDPDRGALARLTAIVDAAAEEAGRDPREIRRGVVVSAADTRDVGALVAIALDHGMSTFVLDVEEPGDADLVRSFAETAAELRRSVEGALPPGALSSRPVRRAQVRAQRHPGIAYDEIPEELADRAVEPGDPAYATVRSTYMRGGQPGLVLRPRDAAEVAAALAFAHQHRHLPLGIRSGGHGISGRSTNHGGLVIDVGALDEITVLDESERLVRIGPGARWRDVASALQPHGWALSSGDYGGVGVGGIATSGGIGFLNRAHGLTIDHLRAVEMVLADGELVRATATENPDLFWAVRGAGANFGVAVTFEFVVDEVAEVGWAQLAFQVPDTAAYLRDYGRVVTEMPRQTTPFLILGDGVAQVMAMVDSTDPEVIVAQLQPLAEIAPLVQQQVVIAPYAAVMNMFPEAPHDGRGEPVSRSVLVREITPEFAAASAELIRSGASHWYQIRAVGGAVADVAPDETAYAHRDAAFSLTVMGANAQRLDRWFEPLRRHSDGLYLSFESGLDPERIHDAFPPATLRRLRDLKTRLDPTNLFQDNFNVAPTSATARSQP